MRRTIAIIAIFALGLCGIGLTTAANAAAIGPYNGTSGTVNCSTSGTVTITNNVLTTGRTCSGTVTIPSGVTSIGASAFMSATSLTGLTIPATVTTIGANAFYMARALTSISIPAGVTSFSATALKGTSALTSITVDSGNANYSSTDGVLFDKLGKTLIAYPIKKSDTSYSIPSGTTTIGDAAFFMQATLTSVTIPTSVTAIGNDSFYAATALTSITIPDGVTSIGNNTFSSATKLARVSLPTSLRTIGISAFANTSLGDEVSGSLLIPEGVTSIGANAFSGAMNLVSISLPSTLGTLGDGAFSGTQSLEQITVADANGVYSSVEGVLFNKDRTTLITYPVRKSNTSYVIPTGVKNISQGAFYAATTLTSVTIPDGALSIGDNAFFASSLTSVTIPSSVTSLGTSAFYNSSALATVTLGSGLLRLGSYVFGNCAALTSITIPPNVTTIEDSAFAGATSLSTVSIPASVTALGMGVFTGDTGLTSITVDSANANYSSIAGVLYNKAATTLIQYPAKKSDTHFTVPTGVTTIGSSSFNGASTLTSLMIPASVQTVEESVFNGASSLRNVYFLGNAPISAFGTFSGIASDPKAFIRTSATGFGNVGDPWNTLTIDQFDYLVTYSSVDGANITPNWMKSGSAIPTAPTLPLRVGYTFAGWSATDGGSVVTFPYTPAADTVLYAKWNKNPVAAVATTVPSIKGKAIASAKGKYKLTANKGVWTGDPVPALTYQWYACTGQVKSAASAVPKSCKKIAKATKPTLAVINAFKGKFIAVAVTGTVAGTPATVSLSKSSAKVK